MLVGCLSFVNFGVVACGKKGEVYQVDQEVKQPVAKVEERRLGAWLLQCSSPVNGRCECPETKAAQGTASALCVIINSNASSGKNANSVDQEAK